MLDSLVRVSRRVLKVPKATASLTGVIGLCPRTPQQTATTGPAPALGPEHRFTVYARRRLDAYNAAPRHLCIPSSGRAGSDRFRRTESHDTTDGAAHVSTLDPHPTGRDVLQGEKCTRSTARRARHASGPSGRDRSSKRNVTYAPLPFTNRDAVESPPSTFRVSQVYP